MMLVATGIPPLDRFLDGGLASGSTILLLAPTGSGSEVFSKQFAAGTKDMTIYVSTDESENDVRQAAKEMGWNLNHVEVLDIQTRFANRILDADQSRTTLRAPAGGQAQKRRFDPRSLVEDTSSEDVLVRKSATKKVAEPAPAKNAGNDVDDDLRSLVDPFRQLRRPRRFILDNVDFYLNQFPLEVVLTTLQAIKAANSREGGVMLWVLSKGAHPISVERRLELIADCLLELEVTRKGTSFERFFLVKKVRNRNQSVGVSTYDVTDNGFELETLERIV